MARRSSTLSVTARSFGALFSNLGTLLPMTVVMGVIIAVLDMVVYQLLAPPSGPMAANIQQTALIKLMFGWWGVMLALEILIGPILVAMVVFIARSHTHGQKATLYQAMNFALSRYTLIFKWHAVAWLSIQVGMIVLVPGILFLLQYAFVDSILCLEDEPWPLARSTKLTRGRRRRIFVIVFVWLVLNQAVGILELGVLEMGLLPLVGLMSGVYMLNVFVLIAFYMFYEDRTTPADA